MSDITRENYEQFCREPDLSVAERRAWWTMREDIFAAVANGEETLPDFINPETSERWKALDSVKDTPGWSGFVEWIDTNRRMRRAELAAWREWCIQHKKVTR